MKFQRMLICPKCKCIMFVFILERSKNSLIKINEFRCLNCNNIFYCEEDTKKDG